MVMARIALARTNSKLAGDVVFAGTAGEAVNYTGEHQLLTQDLGPVSGLVVGEPNRLEVVPTHKGTFWLEITISSKVAHGSMTDNSIFAMHRLLERLLAYRPSYHQHPLLGPPTINLGTIQGGLKTNVVANRCVLHVDLRPMQAGITINLSQTYRV